MGKKMKHIVQQGGGCDAFYSKRPTAAAAIGAAARCAACFAYLDYFTVCHTIKCTTPGN